MREMWLGAKVQNTRRNEWLRGIHCVSASEAASSAAAGCRHSSPGSGGWASSAPSRSCAADKQGTGVVWWCPAGVFCAGWAITDRGGTHHDWELTFKLFPRLSWGVHGFAAVSLIRVIPYQCWNLPLCRTEMCYCCSSRVRCFRSFRLKYVNVRYIEMLCNMAGGV